MTVKERKIAVMNEILNAYEVYKGQGKSRLESLINQLQKSKKLSSEDYNELINTLADHDQSILDVLAQSLRVRVCYNYTEMDKTAACTRDDIDELWKDLK